MRHDRRVCSRCRCYRDRNTAGSGVRARIWRLANRLWRTGASYRHVERAPFGRDTDNMREDGNNVSLFFSRHFLLLIEPGATGLSLAHSHFHAMRSTRLRISLELDLSLSFFSFVFRSSLAKADLVSITPSNRLHTYLPGPGPGTHLSLPVISIFLSFPCRQISTIFSFSVSITERWRFYQGAEPNRRRPPPIHIFLFL